jgi:hypothetical protein
MSDEAAFIQGEGRLQRTSPDGDSAERVAGIPEQTDKADRRKIAADAAREIAERSAQLNERLREQ